MIRVLLVDDKASVREEMRRLLELEEDIRVVGEAADGWEAIRNTHSLNPDLILMDKAMPSLDGIEATRLIKKDHPRARIVFLAAEDAWRQEALQAGAEAYLLKDLGFDSIIKTIKKTIEPLPHIRKASLLQTTLIEPLQKLWAQSPALTMGLLTLLLLAISDVALLLLPLSALELVARVLINYSLAAVSLFFGIFFFAYALKYYASIALILLFNGENGLVNGNGHGEGKRVRNGLRNGFRKIFGNGVEDAFANGYGLKPETQPFVSIHLPLYNEREVVDRLLTACTSLDYENYEVIVADDSTDETTKILERWTNHPRVKISHRHDRTGFKGGALQVALQRTDPRAEFIMVFDADFIPRPGIIPQFLAYFYGGNGDGQRYADDRVAVVQGYQWHMLNASENWITRGIRVEFSGSYVIERPGQQLLGSMKMIAGSVFMIRADLLRKHGWGISITEDWELTLRLYLDGYKVLYTPFIQAPAECISRFQQLVKQRMRWARGHTFNVKKYFWRVLTSANISWREKAEFLYYAPYYLQSVFFIIGTTSWLTSELILHQRLPYWTALFGWSLVFTNTFALVMANLSGLFLERGVRHNWSGIFSFLVLSNLLVPFQAYAALQGLLGRDEGGWHRTPKSGRITEILGKLRLGKKLERLLPKGKKRPGAIDIEKRLGLATSLPPESNEGGEKTALSGRRTPPFLQPTLLPLPGRSETLRRQLYGATEWFWRLLRGEKEGEGATAHRWKGQQRSRFASPLPEPRLATALIMVSTALILSLSALAFFVPVALGNPDTLYLHPGQPPETPRPTSYTGYLDSNSSPVTSGLDEVRLSSGTRTARWYTEIYPNGVDPAGIQAGNYTLTLYYRSAGAGATIQVFWEYCDPNGSNCQTLGSSAPTTLTGNAVQQATINFTGNGISFSQPKRFRLRITRISGSVRIRYDYSGNMTNINTPNITVPEGALFLAPLALAFPFVARRLQRRKARRSPR